MFQHPIYVKEQKLRDPSMLRTYVRQAINITLNFLNRITFYLSQAHFKKNISNKKRSFHLFHFIALALQHNVWNKVDAFF